jgi:hypothetical protein
MLAALTADLLILRPTVMFLRKRMPWGSGRRTIPKPAE